MLDDGYATVRATLARHLIDEPSPVGGRLACRLQFYWYYRAGLVEGTRWLQLGRDAVRDGDPADAMLAEMALAAALLVQGRADQARPPAEAALDRLPLIGPDRLVEVCEGLVGLAASGWLPDAFDLVVRVHGRLAEVVASTSDADLEVLADAVGCVAANAAGRPDDAVRAAKHVHDRAVDLGNIMAAWLSAAPPMIVAMLAGRPDDGVPWVNRLIRGHARLGSGGSGLYVENRANFAAQSGNFREAARLYAAARLKTRRNATVSPQRQQQITRHLLELTRSRLGPADFERAWQEGERLSLDDIVLPESPS